ncbi:hypothetical protein MJO29_005646 [Puccinia striiformis f. sp. tritici]|nr:hypothetical protein MJO29_005646 [Puccinia striiformis f. sp. tritici]
MVPVCDPTSGSRCSRPYHPVVGDRSEDAMERSEGKKPFEAALRVLREMLSSRLSRSSPQWVGDELLSGNASEKRIHQVSGQVLNVDSKVNSFGPTLDSVVVFLLSRIRAESVPEALGQVWNAASKLESSGSNRQVRSVSGGSFES